MKIKKLFGHYYGLNDPQQNDWGSIIKFNDGAYLWHDLDVTRVTPMDLDLSNVEINLLEFTKKTEFMASILMNPTLRDEEFKKLHPIAYGMPNICTRGHDWGHTVNLHVLSRTLGLEHARGIYKKVFGRTCQCFDSRIDGSPLLRGSSGIDLEVDCINRGIPRGVYPHYNSDDEMFTKYIVNEGCKTSYSDIWHNDKIPFAILKGWFTRDIPKTVQDLPYLTTDQIIVLSQFAKFNPQTLIKHLPYDDRMEVLFSVYYAVMCRPDVDADAIKVIGVYDQGFNKMRTLKRRMDNARKLLAFRHYVLAPLIIAFGSKLGMDVTCLIYSHF